MKKFFLLLLFFCYSSVLYAQDVGSKADAQVSDFFGYAIEINKKYPDEGIDKDLSFEIKEKFNLREKDAKKVENVIKKGIKTYRFFNKKYNDIKQRAIVPDVVPRQMSDLEYKKVQEDSDYKKSDELVVTNNFLRTIPYSFSKKNFEVLERKHYENFLRQEPKTQFDVLRQKLAKVSLKRILKTGELPDFKTANGSGEWVDGNNVSARIISSVTKIGDNEKIYAAVHFDVSPEYGMVYAPKVDFGKSKNLLKVDVLYPAPKIYVDKNKENKAFYFGNFALPVILYPKDINKPLEINGDFNLSICNEEQVCKNVELSSGLELENGVAFNGASDVFIYSGYGNIPKDDYFDAIKNVYYNQNNDIVVEVDKKFDASKTFVYVVNQKTYAPMIKIKPYGFDAVFEPVYKTDENKISSAEILLSVNGIDFGSYNKKIEPHKGLSFRNIESFFAGLFTNFYPWAIVLFMLMMYDMPNKKEQIRRKAVLYFCSLVLFLTFGYFIYKNLPYWGFLMQNSYYMVIMVFIVIFLISGIKHWINVSLIIKPFLYSFLVFLFLGLQTRNIFFEGLNWIVFSLGLVLPYVLLYIKPNVFKKYFRPSKRFDNIKNIVVILLSVQLVWLLVCVESFLMALMAFLAVAFILFFNKTKRHIEETYKETKRAVKRLYQIMLSLIFVCFFCSMFFVKINVNNNVIDIKEDNVLVSVVPNWCIGCKITDFVIYSKNKHSRGDFIKTTQMSYNQEGIKYLKKIDIKSPPLYVLYSKRYPSGIVLPYFMGEKEINKYVMN